MRRFGSIIAAFLLVIVLLAIEIIIIKSMSKYEPQLGVVFAKVKIPEKTAITPEMLEVKEVGVAFAHRQSLRNIMDVTAKKARMDIEAGEMILSGKLGTDEMEEITVKDKTKRLFSVEFKGDQANGWWLMADQNVDITFVPAVKADGQAAAPDSSLQNGMQRLRNIRVAALIDDRGKLLEDTVRATLPKYVSFEVTDAQAAFLAYAKGNGRLEISVIPGQ